MANCYGNEVVSSFIESLSFFYALVPSPKISDIPVLRRLPLQLLVALSSLYRNPQHNAPYMLQDSLMPITCLWWYN